LQVYLRKRSASNCQVKYDSVEKRRKLEASEHDRLPIFQQ